MTKQGSRSIERAYI